MLSAWEARDTRNKTKLIERSWPGKFTQGAAQARLLFFWTGTFTLSSPASEFTGSSCDVNHSSEK
jgi:hypothetical protein